MGHACQRMACKQRCKHDAHQYAGHVGTAPAGKCISNK